MCAAINLSRGTSAIAVMIDNARALITTLLIICLHLFFSIFILFLLWKVRINIKQAVGTHVQFMLVQIITKNYLMEEINV